VLEEFGPDIWIVDGPTVTAAAGFRYPTRMAVIRLAGGDLVLWSPVELSNELRAEMEALGTRSLPGSPKFPSPHIPRRLAASLSGGQDLCAPGPPREAQGHRV